MSTLRKNLCYINGKWVGTPETAITNPANDSEIVKVPNLGAAETKDAIAAAKDAMGPWSKMLAKERSAILRKWYELMVANADELAAILTEEQGKPLAEAKRTIPSRGRA